MTATKTSSPSWKIAPDMQDGLARLADIVGQVMGDTLAGLTAYGAVLSPNFDAARMSAQTVLVVNRVEIERLKSLAARGVTLGRLNITSPLVLTEDFIADSADSFPLELLEIHQRRHTLMGRDCFAAITLQAEHVRLQCERELRRIQLRMRQGLLASTGQSDALDELQTDVAGHLLRTLRGLLWLHGRTEFIPRQQVVEECERMLKLSVPGLRTAIQLHLEHTWSDFQALYDDVEKLVSAADKW